MGVSDGNSGGEEPIIIPGLDVHPLLLEQERGAGVGQAPDASQIAAANRALEVLNDIDFRVGEEAGKPVVSLIDTPSGRVIRRIPGEELAELSKRMKTLKGLLHGRQV